MKMQASLQNFFTFLSQSRKRQILFICGIIVLILLVVAVLLAIIFRGASNLPLKIGEETPKDQKGLPKDYALPTGVRTIDGMPVGETVANLRPIAVVIENLVTVRPQAGLSEANVVYEALAEGGIPRFLAIYSGKDVPKIGPVRSARIYFLDWVAELDAMFAHCGGDPYALRLLDQSQIKDFDQMGNGSFFWRAAETEAPHNLFTQSALLLEGMASKGWEDVGNFQPWLFKTEPPLEARPQNVQDIYIDFSGPAYQVSWKYDRESNTYLRYNAGIPHLDRNSGQQIRAKNVVVQYVVAKLKDDGASTGRLGMHTIGGDQALVFQDGTVTQAIWKKNYREDRTRFYTRDWREIEFNPGAIWVEVIPPERTVAY